MPPLDFDNQPPSYRRDRNQGKPHPGRRVAEYKVDLGQIGDQFRNQLSNWEESPLNPERWFGESVPSSDEEAIRRSVEKQFKKRGEFMIHLAVFAVINALLWLIFAFAAGPVANFLELGDLAGLATSFPWPLLVTLGWGSGMAAHAVDTYYETGNRASRRERMIRQAARDQYGDDWHETISKGDYNSLRSRILKPLKKRAEFLQHAAVYVAINLMLWLIYFGTNSASASLGGALSEIPEAVFGFPWPLIVMLGWGAGLVAHGVDAFIHGAVGSAQEAAIQRAIERERALEDYAARPEKPKRDVAMRLSDDGELIDLDYEDMDVEKPKRQASR